MRRKDLVIVGNGNAACRLLDELMSRGARDRYDITVFGEERGGAYNRVLLSKVLAGEAPDSIVTKPPAWYERNGVRLVSGTSVARIDTASRAVVAADGARQRYDVAVLATGSQPLVPPLEGMTTSEGDLRPGVFVYRTMDDCVRMRGCARAGDNAIVVGGGLLGLEAAKVLSDMGLHVTVIHVAKSLMNAQLDQMGGDMLEQHIERCGIFVRTGRTVEAICGEEAVEGCRLDDGSVLPADMVVLACGVRPRVDVARASNLPINKGIVVNDTMATQVPGIYAIGECAEHRGRLYGIVTPIWEQAAVLADVLTGANPQARYRGTKLYTRLKVAGVDVTSMGSTEPELESDDVLQVVETRKSTYRKLILRDGRLLGAQFVGNTAAAATLVQLFDRNDPLPADPLEALCPGGGAGPAAQAERVVCTCHKVSEATLREAIEGGACSLEAACAATKAGTGCGSCRGEVAQLVARHAPSPEVAGGRAVAVG
ncbi:MULTISPECIES: FAD-dependent oxidoreductase [Sorangium]|uniref:Nitrite reductase (NAD(P)H) n=1 Tax=Sorangium cellulosum (strain So ce56) TaxID=448385 RepID=A9F0V9_SORC5|nr:FAD-dependent oxidoreductase [Sorangium cellulosum]CAN91307.1 Nitrite reductase (NAD(P)H) [Sorangium cellulosum So ce56]